MSSPSGNQRKRVAFLAAANKLCESKEADEVLADTWPDWLMKVLLRFARFFLPELQPKHFRVHSEKFFGTLAGLQMDLSGHLEKTDLTAFSATPVLRKLRKEARDSARADQAAIKKTQLRAMDLPIDGRLMFNAALGQAVDNQIAADVLQRVQTSPTVKICFFLILKWRAIENREFGSVAKLFEQFRQSFFGREDPAGNGDPMLSMKAQFQKICSECGVRLAAREFGRAETSQPAERGRPAYEPAAGGWWWRS